MARVPIQAGKKKAVEERVPEPSLERAYCARARASKGAHRSSQVGRLPVFEDLLAKLPSLARALPYGEARAAELRCLAARRTWCRDTGPALSLQRLTEGLMESGNRVGLNSAGEPSA